MKKINKYCLLTIITLGIFFFGGNIIFDNNISKGVTETLEILKGENQSQNSNLFAAVDWFEYGTQRYVGPGVANVACGDIVYPSKCDGNTTTSICDFRLDPESDVIYKTNRGNLFNSKPKCNDATEMQYKTKLIEPNKQITLNSDVSWCSFSATNHTLKTSGNATLKVEGHACKFIATTAGIYYAYLVDSNGVFYQYDITVRASSNVVTPPNNTVTPPSDGDDNTVVVPVSETTSNIRYSQGAIAYSDSNLQDGKFTVPCGDQVIFQDIDKNNKITQEEDIEAACIYGEGDSDERYCKVIYERSYTIYIERAKLRNGEPNCEEDSTDNPADKPSNEKIVAKNYYYVKDYKNPTVKGSEHDLSCGDKIYITFCLSDDICDVGKINGKEIDDNFTSVYTAALQKSASGLNCDVKDEEETDEIEKCNPVSPLKNQKSKTEKKIKVCFNVKNGKETAVKENEKEVFTCVNGYRRNMRAVSNTCDKLNKSSKTQLCSKEFMYSCNSVLRPTLEGSGSLENNGKGTITIKGKDSASKSGLKGYFIYTDKTPTSSSIPESFNGNSYEAKKEFTPGTYFASVITNDGILSYPLTLSIHSDEITTTAEIILASPDGNLNYAVTALEKGKIGYESTVSSSDYVRLSNQLNNDSMLATGFDLFTTGYEVTVEADQIAVFATLKSTDARYVDGYGSRTVDLNYGRNVILVKIVNNKGHERTYTFVVNRTDNRENKNILSNLTTSVGKINFDPYVSDYTISVPKNATSVTINGTLASSEASFIEGYQPRVVILDNDITSAVIKTISKAGITRNYILTFVKTGSDVEVDYEDSVYLSSLTIAGKDLLFEKDNLSYSASVDYETEDVTVYAFAESPNAVVDIRGNYGLQVGPNKIEVLVTNGSNSKMYNIFINRKEDGLNVSGNTKLETLTVKDYDILFNPDVEDYSIKIKKEKTLLLTATPQSDRSEVYMYGNNDLTAYSTIRIKVIAENGDTGLYSVDIIKDLYDKDLETTAAIIGSIIIFGAVIIIIVRKKRKSLKDYIEV